MSLRASDNAMYCSAPRDLARAVVSFAGTCFALRRGTGGSQACLRSYRFAVGLALLFALGSGVHASASDNASFVLRAKYILPVSAEHPEVIEDGVIVVRDGRIAALGADVAPPPDLPLIELSDGWVTPGLVAAMTSLAPPHTGQDSVGAAFAAIYSYDVYAEHAVALSSGVTAVHLNPGTHRLLSGQGGVVKLAGPPEQRVMRARADLTINADDAAVRPPRKVTYRTPASSDVAIPPAERQRPDSRLGMWLALEEALAGARRPGGANGFDLHGPALVEAWEARLPLRVQTQRRADIQGALSFLARHERDGYLVGGAEAGAVAESLRAQGVPLVFLVDAPWSASDRNVGTDPEALQVDVAALRKLDGGRTALAPRSGAARDLRLAAALAVRAGLPRQQALAAITRIPADILGVGERIGSLAVGKDADLVVFTDDPLSTGAQVRAAFVGGVRVYTVPSSEAVVVRGETVWVDEATRFSPGAVLIEKGKITAVGHSVPQPPFAKVIEGGPGSFVTPGFVDARGHLGLEGDRAAPGPELTLADIVGVPDVTDERVARAGVTTQVLTPYAVSALGSQVAAIKTYGATRPARVLRAAAGVYFDLSDADAADIEERVGKRLETAKKYLEKWQKYEKELAEWQEKRAKGETVEAKPKAVETKEASEKTDPITGTWSVTISGGPIPEPQTATMRLRLEGNDIEGRIVVPGAPEEAKVVATFDGTHISGHIEIDTGGLGYPAIEADLVGEDHIVGKISFQGIEIDLDARRTDKGAVEFSVVRRRTRGKDGRPLPPKVDEALEPLRRVLEKTVPLVAQVRTAAQISALLSLAEKNEFDLVLVNAEGAAAHAESLKERGIGVVLPTELVREKLDRWYVQADDLSRREVAVAFQSEAEDGAYALPLVGLRAVERGMAADSALAAFTVHASRMFKLDDRIGSLAAGKDGDVLVFSGHPFAASSRVLRVLINGEEVR